MPAFRVQHVATCLVGMLCLCLVPGCAGHNRHAKPEIVSPLVSSGIGRIQPATAPEIRAEVGHDDQSPIQVAFDVGSETSDRMSGFSTPPKDSTVPRLDAPGPSSTANVVPTGWARQEASGTDRASNGGEHESISEVFPAPSYPALQRTISLREVIDTALIQNPEVVTARAAAPVASAALGVAATYPWNPTVQVGVFPYARDVEGNLLAVKNQVAVTQTMELAHQPQFRWRAANAAWKGDDMAGAVDRRFAAGLATPTERITATVAARRSQRRAELTEADYRTALLALRVVLNIGPDEDIRPSGSLPSFGWLPTDEVLDRGRTGIDDASAADDADDAITQMTANRPDVMAARLGASAAGANLDLARANRIPNVTAGPSYERDEAGTLFVGLTAQMDLPVWNSGCPLVRQRSTELQQQLISWRQTQARAAAEARAAVDRYERARHVWLESSISRSAGDDELKSINGAFEQGQASIIEVLATRDNLIQERQIYLDLLNRVSQAAVDVIAALAIDPERLIEAPSGAASDSAKR
jgi:cobalt-zinc-cadmium efflux system outer membrane protein